MRVAAILPFVLLAATAAGQAPTPRPVAPTSPASGAPGSAAPAPRSSPAPPSKDPHTGIIRGRVVRADSGQPLAGARVRLETEAAITDDEGRYELKGLRAGTHTPTASRTGFVTMHHGEKGERMRSLALTVGQVLDDIDFALLKGAVVSGVILDDMGEPLPAAHVWVLRQQYQNGERRLVPVMTADTLALGGSSGSDATDDLGQFRLFGLVPGTYYLAARASSGPQASRPSAGVDDDVTLYPGSMSLLNASPITLGAGEEIGGLSFAVQPVKTATLRGTVRTADGRTGRYSLRIVGGSEIRGTFARPVQTTAADGSFTIPNLAPGRYTLSARDGGLVAVASVVVTGDDLIVPLMLSQGRTARGRVVFESDASSPNASQPSVLFLGNDILGTVAATVARDGTFEATGLTGLGWVSAGAPGGWDLKRVERDGLDITDTLVDFDKGNVSGIEVVLTQRLPTVTGRVADERGRAAAGAVVVMFAEDPQKWKTRRLLRTARPDQDGRFSLQGMPPSRYVAVAVADLEAGEETNPEMLERLSRVGRRVDLTTGAARTIELRVVRVP